MYIGGKKLYTTHFFRFELGSAAKQESTKTKPQHVFWPESRLSKPANRDLTKLN